MSTAGSSLIADFVAWIKAYFKLDATVREAEQVWPSLAKILYVPHDTEYERLVAVLDQLIDEIGNDENHPLASLMEIVGVLIEKYEDEHIPEFD